MRRVPIGATLVVLTAVAAMIALGVWQLRRLDQKRAILARYAANQALPPIALPPIPGDAALFRRARAVCARPGQWRREAGRAADGSSGWRVIAGCGGGATGLAVQLGVGADPDAAPRWEGGPVAGYLTHAPDHRALIAALVAPAPPTMMLVADAPLAGLKANPPASLDDVPNNHLAYAVQWFLFAAVATIVYAVALWRRRHPVAAPPARG